MREEDSHRDRTRRGGGTQEAKPLRSDLENLRREHGQQRFGAAEEDGEEIE